MYNLTQSGVNVALKKWAGTLIYQSWSLHGLSDIPTGVSVAVWSQSWSAPSRLSGPLHGGGGGIFLGGKTNNRLRKEEEKIQGDGRKFLDGVLTELFWVKNIITIIKNEIHIYRLQPKSATKDDFFHIFLSLIVSSSRRMLPFDRFDYIVSQ